MVVWDYPRDLVTVHFRPEAASPDAMARLISELGYTPEVTDTAAGHAAVAATPRLAPVLHDAPAFFVDAFERARAAKRPLVIDFWAPWCPACRRLKHETLEHAEVAEALESVEVLYVDLDEFPGLGAAYGVAAIPDVVFVDRNGAIVGRLQTFEPPAQFLDRLTSWLAGQ
jgi:thiol-disulfide isomerase/thioredoxin